MNTLRTESGVRNVEVFVANVLVVAVQVAGNVPSI
jgi:hypothetical protein